MKTLQQLGIILYKNLLLRSRQWFVSTLELILPILMVNLICWIAPSYDFVGYGLVDPYSRPVDFKESAWCDHVPLIAYFPENPETNATMVKLGKECKRKVINFTALNSEETLDTNFSSLFGSNNGFGVVFPDGLAPLKGNVTDGIISYKLRARAGTLPTTAKLMPKPGDLDFKKMGPNYQNGKMYVESHFLSLQLSLENVLARLITGLKNFNYMVNLESIIYPPYLSDEYKGALWAIPLLPIGLAISVLFMIPTITRNVVSEKQTGMTELLKSSGVSGWIQWLGWMLNSIVPMIFTITVCTIIMFSRVGKEYDAFYQNEAVLVFSDWTVIWLILFLYINAIFSFCILVCAIFQTPIIATSIAIIFWLATAFVPLFIPGSKIVASLIPNCALTYAFAIAWKLETTVEDESDKPMGIQWDSRIMHLQYPKVKNYRSWPGPEIIFSDISMFQIIMMLLADVIVYFLLALYLDAVLPTEHGVRRPWYIFNFKQCFKRKPSGRTQQVSPVTTTEQVRDPDSMEKEANNKPPTALGDSSSFEPEPNKTAGIEIQNIYKRFGRKAAVNGVSLKMYTGDIFVLLGHNGAGKTTLISMLTGFFAPSRGTAIVGGNDIRYDMEKARGSMGLCPQHNMIFDKLTVSDQMLIFGMLRGLSCKQANQETDFLLSKMGFVDKASTLAHKLSGGQKRKLSLGMALIGGTKVVVLDEVTSGMDPQARREVWDLLLELRGDRTMLLTTHFMEEADALGDRLGVMANGRLQCCGSSQFLKKYYGTGYTLKLTLKGQANPKETGTNNLGNTENQDPPPQFNEPSAVVDPEVVTNILTLIRKYVHNATPKSDARNDANSNELFFNLPADTGTTAVLTQLLTELNGSKEKLGLQTIGLQQTTMDEVFLRVGEIADMDEKGTPMSYDWTIDDFQKVPKKTGFQNIMWQFVALLIKRWIMFKRKWLLKLLEFLVPYLIIIGSILLIQEAFDDHKKSEEKGAQSRQNARGHLSTALEPKLLISLDSYTNPVTYYSADGTMSPHVKDVIGSSARKVDGPDVQAQLLNIGKSDVRQYKKKYIIAVGRATKSTNFSSITTLFNAFPYHAAPLAINVATNIALRSANRSKIKIEMFNHPMGIPVKGPPPLKNPNGRSRQSSSQYGQYGRPPPPPISDAMANNWCPLILEHQCRAFAIVITLGLILLTSAFVMTPIQEKISNGKQLQLMTGVHRWCYWCADFACDIAHYSFLVLLVFVAVFAIELSPGYHRVLSFGREALVLFLILMIYGFVSILLANLVARRMSTVMGGYCLLVLIHLLTGVILGFMALMLVQFNSPTWWVLILLKVICYPFSSMPAMLIFNRYFQIAIANAACDYTKGHQPIPHLLWDRLDEEFSINAKSATLDTFPEPGQDLLYILLNGLFYFVLYMLLEYNAFRKCCSCAREDVDFIWNTSDEDVSQEAERVSFIVQNGQVHQECLVVDHICKAFNGFVADSQVSFGVHYGECFGLLGVNGAGKTTLFKMITGDEQPTMGNMFGFGASTTKNARKFFSNIGYCPQFDANIGDFTGREMLELFGVLRGIPYNVAKTEALKWLQRFGLSDSANVRSGKYSGGMKRRLCTAMAMIGDPALILLDEPTSGVDPVSRHQFWGILTKLRLTGQSVILTSHSMEECEALCSRLGIMVNGQFQCFGGVQHLKSKYAQGYSLTLKLKTDSTLETGEFEEKSQKCEQAILEQFEPCVLKDKHNNLLQYDIQNTSISYDVLFKTMEGIKAKFESIIEEYSVNETSLEEVFLSFARAQYAPRTEEMESCKQICTCRC